MNKFLYLIEYFNEEPIIIQLVWLVSCVLFVTAIVLILYLKTLRSYLRKNEKNISKFENEYESNLIAYLYSGNEEEMISKEQFAIISKMKTGILDSFKRKIFVSVLLKLKSEISGEMEESIQNLYNQTNLKSYAEAKLNSRDWYAIASGIRELTLFQVKEAHSKIVKFSNHPRKEVRKEVQLYLVSLFSFEGLNFLNDLETSLSEWDQIQLLEELQKFENQQIPDITLWLKSKNEYVVIFALKLAKIYNQFEMSEVLLDLLNHKSEKVRLELIPVLSHLYVVDAKEILKNNFSKSSIDEKIVFFKLLENLADVNDEPFILEHIHHENFEIKFSALKILKNCNINTFKSLELIPSESEFVKIVKFIENN